MFGEVIVGRRIDDRHDIPRTLACGFWQGTSIDSMECLGILIERAFFDTRPDPREEVVDYVVVVDLEEGPGEHFLCEEEVVQVCAVMVLAGVAGAICREGGEVCGVFGGPEVEGEGSRRCFRSRRC